MAEVLDQLADRLKRKARSETTGATEMQILNSIAKECTDLAAQMRDDAEQQRIVAERADADRRAAEQRAEQEKAAAGLDETFDPADHTSQEVNNHLEKATGQERARVLELETQDRPDVPSNRKQRTGILNGPFATTAPVPAPAAP